MKKLVVLTGAGISAASGLKTFRDSGGLWEQHDIMEVASIEGWYKNPKLVLEFYNNRRAQLQEVFPNEAHHALVALEQKFDVYIVTQNVDDLHERAGSSNIIHLHGKLLEAKSENKNSSVGGKKIKQMVSSERIEMGDLCEQGYQLRPNIVWFGEDVPEMQNAMQICRSADILLVIGTSLQVYPAASLVDYVPQSAEKYLIDPNLEIGLINGFTFIQENAVEGVPRLAKKLLSE